MRIAVVSVKAAGVRWCWGDWVKHPLTLPLIAPALLLFTGCQVYVQPQVELIEHSRKGMTMISQSLDAQRKSIEEFQRHQRRAIDDAFDTDVRAQSSLDADWVIDHRTAYATAIDALNDSRHQQQLSNQQDQRTLAAVELALKKLEWLVTLPAGRQP